MSHSLQSEWSSTHPWSAAPSNDCWRLVEVVVKEDCRDAGWWMMDTVMATDGAVRRWPEWEYESQRQATCPINLILYQEPMPMWKSHISRRGASSGPGKHEATGRVLSRFWWFTSLGNVRFLHGHGFLLLSHDQEETSRQPCGNHAHPFLYESCFGHGIIMDTQQ